jgi:hypothetical protein
LGARRRILAQTIGNARGLDINLLRSEKKIILKTCDFVDISNTTIPIALGGSITALPPIVAVILRQQLTYLYIIDYGRADDGAHDKKLSFPLPRVNYHLFSPHPTLGGSAMKQSSCISLTSKKL